METSGGHYCVNYGHNVAKLQEKCIMFQPGDNVKVIEGLGLHPFVGVVEYVSVCLSGDECVVSVKGEINGKECSALYTEDELKLVTW